jgi:hypothetical protein
VIAVALTFLRGVSLRTWALIGAGVVVLALGLFLRAHWIDVGESRVQARWDAAEAAHAIKRAEAVIAARVLEQRHRDELKAVADRFLTEQRKADEDHAAAVAAVRVGTVRVRDRFTCPSPGVPAASADPGSADDAGPRGLQPADLEYLLGIGAEADAIARRLNALQEACRVR